MKKIYLLALLIVFTITSLNAQVTYQTLHTNATFSGRQINQNLPVGSVSASADVVSGGSTYSIPIAIPPGTNGIAPSLSIDYNSMGGNGNLGVGWNIVGLSVISRSGQSLYYDNKVTPVDLSSEDRFVMAGQRLISKIGTYGADGTTYGTENEDFSTVTTHASAGIIGTGWFEVVTKDGIIIEYGNTDDSRILNYENDRVLLWEINRITYKDGNYIEFKYEDHSTPRISEINYTGNVAAGPH